MTRIAYFQEGGGMPQQGAPQGGGGEDPTAQLQAMVQEYAQTQDPQLAVAIADTLVQAMGLSGGGGQPQGAPAPEQGMEQPAYRTGGKLVSAYDQLKAFKKSK
jgi:ABC-type Na+ efflux pump permease subunit